MRALSARAAVSFHPPSTYKGIAQHLSAQAQMDYTDPNVQVCPTRNIYLASGPKWGTR